MKKLAIVAATLLLGTAGASASETRIVDTLSPIQVVGKSDTAMCVTKTENMERSDAMYWCNRAIARAETTIDARAVAHLHRGVLHIHDNNLKAARADIDRAIELTPHYGDAYFNLGNIHFAEKRFTDAVAAYAKALEIGVTVPELVYYNRGKTYSRLGQEDLAKSDLEKAKSLTDSGSALNNRLSSAR